MFRNIYIVLCLVLTLSTGAFAEESATTQPVPTDDGPVKFAELSISGFDKYVLPNGVNLYDQPVIQTNLFILFTGGFTFDVWTSVPTDFKTIGENYATEIDLSLGWCGKVGDYNVSASVNWYDTHKTLTPEDSDMFVLIAEVSRKFEATPDLSVSPFVRIEAAWSPDGFFDAYTTPRVGACYDWKINNLLNLKGKAMVLYDPGTVGAGNAAWVGTIEANLLWKLSKNVAITLPSIRCVTPLTSVSDGRKTETILGAGVSFNF